MTSPDRETFLELAATHGVVPVWRERLADFDTPLSVYARMCGEGPSFMLESAEHGERWGRYSFVGADPFLELIGRDGRHEFRGDVAVDVDPDVGPLEALDRVTATLHAPAGLVGVPLHGGAVGLIGYDAVREVEDIPDTGRDDLGLPDVHLMFPRVVVGLDHLRQSMTVVVNVVVGDDPAAQYDDALARLDRMDNRLSGPAPERAPLAPPVAGDVGEVTANMAPADYEKMVEAVKEYVLAGDTFQTVPSQRFEVATDADALTLYRALRILNPSPYLFLIDMEDFQLVGSSPEALVTVTGDRAETWPIAGTRPRGRTPKEDRELERELIADAKERAEHVMLVDLARNDLGRVCRIGSVAVDDMMDIERFSHVMHITSTVSGTLREDATPVDVIRAVFPAGTLSGAPKVRAMQIIDELEPTRRGPYGGVVGYVDFGGNVDLCIAIRTLTLKDGTAYVQAGAGVVADSDPAREQQETRDKARAVLAAVEAVRTWQS